jgi:UMF1 family MFS transporter
MQGAIIKGNKKIINAWATYDLANSVYNLVITATIFPIYYNIVTSTRDASGNVISSDVSFLGVMVKNTALYDWAIAAAYLLVSIIIPILSGIADYGGSKKLFMRVFSMLGATACSLMYFFDSSNLFFGLLMAILACIGFAGSLVFYNAYLPEIAAPEEQDRVSAKGFAMGYWGSAILLIACLALIMTRTDNADKLMMMRYAFLAVGVWWFGFSQISFHYLPDNIYKHKPEGNRFAKGYRELRKVWSELKHNKKLIRFLPAFFIYSMGVQTVMLVANHFGSNEIKMESAELITTILIIQFVAMAGAYLFSFSSRKIGNILTLRIATLIWALICTGTFFLVYTATHFYVVAAFVGLVMGGIQALSRSTYSKLLPATEDPSSYFSFYDVCEKMSIVFGMAIFGFVNQVSDTMRTPIIALVAFFIVGFILLQRVDAVTPEKKKA